MNENDNMHENYISRNEIFYDNKQIDEIQQNTIYSTIDYDNINGTINGEYEEPVLQYPTDINYELAHKPIIYEVAYNDNI